MVSEQELKNIMVRECINCYNVSIEQDLFDKSLILLEKNSMDELIEFIKVNNIKNVFYEYVFYDKDSFIIDEFNEENDCEFDDEFYLLVSKDVEAHNKEIEKLDFSRAMGIRMFCIYEAHYIAIFDCDFWCKELGIMTSEEKMQVLIDDNSDTIDITIDRKNKEQEQNNELLEEEFKNYILNDNKFKNCTNQRFRREYAHSLFNREENEKYKIALGRTDHVNYIENLWRGYKLQKE